MDLLGCSVNVLTKIPRMDHGVESSAFCRLWPASGELLTDDTQIARSDQSADFRSATMIRPR